jgi:hypothetical protein
MEPERPGLGSERAVELVEEVAGLDVAGEAGGPWPGSVRAGGAGRGGGAVVGPVEPERPGLGSERAVELVEVAVPSSGWWSRRGRGRDR